ncbi:hypothetical protein PINS_up003342 [Pythium insidiosum]|nr:hypothetical protein PINS_up003342 [Pythium insidiosum]
MTCELRPLADLRALERRPTPKATCSRAPPSPSSSVAAVGSCYVCDEPLSDSTLVVLRCYHEHCGTLCHSLCLADHFLLEQAMAADSSSSAALETTSESELLRPERGSCPCCRGDLLWPLVVAHPVSLEPTASAPSVTEAVERERETTQTEEVEAEAEAEAEARDIEYYSDSGWFEDEDAYSPRDEEVQCGTRHSDDPPQEVIDLTMD